MNNDGMVGWVSRVSNGFLMHESIKVGLINLHHFIAIISVAGIDFTIDETRLINQFPSWIETNFFFWVSFRKKIRLVIWSKVLPMCCEPTVACCLYGHWTRSFIVCIAMRVLLNSICSLAADGRKPPVETTSKAAKIRIVGESSFCGEILVRWFIIQSKLGFDGFGISFHFSTLTRF